jgi:hypothetical protein
MQQVEKRKWPIGGILITSVFDLDGTDVCVETIEQSIASRAFNKTS